MRSSDRSLGRLASIVLACLRVRRLVFALLGQPMPTHFAMNGRTLAGNLSYAMKAYADSAVAPRSSRQRKRSGKVAVTKPK